MQGKLFRQLKDGSIYEIIGQADNFESSLEYILWSERTGDRQFVPEMILRRQIGWDLVGSTHKFDTRETPIRKVPPPLMKY